MDNLVPENTNWVIIILIFTASISLAGFTSRWLAAIMPALSRFGFFLYLASTTFYFCVITVVMKNLIEI